MILSHCHYGRGHCNKKTALLCPPLCQIEKALQREEMAMQNNCSFVIYFQLCSSPPWESPHQHVANFTSPKPPSAGCYKYIYKYINIINTYPVTVFVIYRDLLVVRSQVMNFCICFQKQAKILLLRVNKLNNWFIDLVLRHVCDFAVLVRLCSTCLLVYLCIYVSI